MTENLYQILGVPDTATKEEIKKAYRTLQMKYHPDKNHNNPESIAMTQKINEAYGTLSDEQNRHEYDMKKNPFAKMNVGNQDIPLHDLFNLMFGRGNPFEPNQDSPFGGKIHVFNGMPTLQSMSKPIPIIKSLHIDIEHVLQGGSFPLEIERWIVENDTKIFEKETIYVDIPQGIDDNEMIILRERGNIIAEHCKGDIKINIVVKNNTLFKRIGLDLLLEKSVSLKEALCGFKFELNHINGKSYILNINKGCIIHPEYKKICGGMGLTRGNIKGNMIIHFHVEFPEKLTEEQIDKLDGIL